jgi:hypothetical protein
MATGTKLMAILLSMPRTWGHAQSAATETGCYPSSRAWGRKETRRRRSASAGSKGIGQLGPFRISELNEVPWPRSNRRPAAPEQDMPEAMLAAILFNHFNHLEIAAE